MKRIGFALLLVIVGLCLGSWGFFAHKKINRIAVFTLPPEMIGFYKRNIHYLTEKSVNPDMRRYVIKEEAPRHYIDLDEYGDSSLTQLPRYWKEAVEQLTTDTLNAFGTVPWHINLVQYQLTQAFLNQDQEKVLKYSADLGHYIADANVPLHTTSNYNGQQTGQVGIHGFWESRLPELFFDSYDLFTGQAQYIDNTQLAAWEAVSIAHMALDSVLTLEKKLTAKFPDSKKYGFEERGNATLRVYSYDFSKRYHDLLNGMVERQMRRSIKLIGDFWYTAWVDGGQPNISEWGLIDAELEDLTLEMDNQGMRGHESGSKVP